MRLRNTVVAAAAVLLLGTGSAAFAQTTGAPHVYVSNPAAGQIVKVVNGSSYQVVFEQRRIAVQDLVVGPDDLLYACAPDSGLVFRFDPAVAPPGGFPYTSATVTTIYQRTAGGPRYPQCGWFSDKGDLFLTDRGSSTAVWEYSNLVPLSPDAGPATLITRVPASDVPAGFNGQGITQAAPGHLLFADANGGAIWSLPFDPIFRFDSPLSPGATIAYSGLTSPIGIARSGNGTLFVATGTEVRSFGAAPCSTLAFGGQKPQFLQFTADDVLYVASTSKQAATLWRVDYSNDGCTVPAAIITFERPTWIPGMSGVAVPRTARSATLDTPPPGVQTDYFFSFKDHAYEVNVAGCTPTIEASETRPECLARLISGGFLTSDPNDPNGEITATGAPVTYAGDGGVAQLYHVTKASGVCDPGIGHAISAYTPLVKNPRIVRCVIPEGTDVCDADPLDPNTYCEIITLDSFFPFNGVFPEDGRIEGSRSTSDFSEYFFADISLAQDSITFDNTPGCFCGWESPLPNVLMLDPVDPFLGLPTFNSGSAVPLKFRVAALPDDGRTCEDIDVCSTSPYGYVAQARALLSIAQVFDGQGEPVFVPKMPVSTSSSVEGSIFGNPSSPNTPYHYNLDTSGYPPGIYQAVAVALTDNFAVDWTYFAVD